MKKSILLVLLLSPVLLFSQNISKEDQEFKDTVHVSELFTERGKSLFSENMILSEKTFCNGRMCVRYNVRYFDTLIFRAIYEGELFTGIAQNFENDTLVGRFTFSEGELIQSFTTYTDGSHYEIHCFKDMLRHGNSSVFWNGKLSHKTHYKNGVAHGPHFAFKDWFDFGYGYLREHGQYNNGKKDGCWIYSSSDEANEFDDLEKQGEIQWVEKYEDGEIQYTNKSF
jgi:antitoxin component YwqK of YwqJK toxin-antitoxin module